MPKEFLLHMLGDGPVAARTRLKLGSPMFKAARVQYPHSWPLLPQARLYSKLQPQSRETTLRTRGASKHVNPPEHGSRDGAASAVKPVEPCNRRRRRNILVGKNIRGSLVDFVTFRSKGKARRLRNVKASSKRSSNAKHRSKRRRPSQKRQGARKRQRGRGRQRRQIRRSGRSSRRKKAASKRRKAKSQKTAGRRRRKGGVSADESAHQKHRLEAVPPLGHAYDSMLKHRNAISLEGFDAVNDDVKEDPLNVADLCRNLVKSLPGAPADFREENFDEKNIRPEHSIRVRPASKDGLKKENKSELELYIKRILKIGPKTKARRKKTTSKIMKKKKKKIVTKKRSSSLRYHGNPKSKRKMRQRHYKSSRSSLRKKSNTQNEIRSGSASEYMESQTRGMVNMMGNARRSQSQEDVRTEQHEKYSGAVTGVDRLAATTATERLKEGSERTQDKADRTGPVPGDSTRGSTQPGADHNKHELIVITGQNGQKAKEDNAKKGGEKDGKFKARAKERGRDTEARNVKRRNAPRRKKKAEAGKQTGSTKNVTNRRDSRHPDMPHHGRPVPQNRRREDIDIIRKQGHNIRQFVKRVTIRGRDARRARKCRAKQQQQSAAKRQRHQRHQRHQFHQRQRQQRQEHQQPRMRNAPLKRHRGATTASHHGPRGRTNKKGLPTLARARGSRSGGQGRRGHYLDLLAGWRRPGSRHRKLRDDRDGNGNNNVNNNQAEVGVWGRVSGRLLRIGRYLLRKFAYFLY